ncbi:MAG TPA: phosphotyrosine protein phosphatase [Allosphingosinicella sp.]|jgi:protein-tyrosine phosphatase
MASRAQCLYLRATEGPAFVQARYGSARGLARLWLAKLRPLRRFEAVDWAAVRRLVFVCTGNICRSPYAEARARAADFPTVSAALRGGSGAPADEAAVAAAAAAGTDLRKHRSTAIGEMEFDAGDLLVAMEPWQAETLAARFGGMPEVQVTLLGIWSTPQRPHLHDPHGLSADYFRTCFTLIDSAVDAMLARIRQ